MPLTAGLRDEENERINNILKRLLELAFVPDLIDTELNGIGLNTATLLKMTPEGLVSHLEKLHFDWQNAENFADFLSQFPEGKLVTKAVAVYEYIQKESKTFSFDIYNKIAAAKAHE
ncbi:hypothetical protein [Flavobacterium sp.]|uniref:hypothetical protein n=1 Tax=Flavobacterium sp. TaxID=239 RepID=UPI0026111BE1|nr:hypothetical protein [Flavobacterium sp.]